MEGSELRLGVYESSSTLCVYLESDAVGATLEHNLWVKFRVALLPAKHAGEPVWKQSAICNQDLEQLGAAVRQGGAWRPRVHLPAMGWALVRQPELPTDKGSLHAAEMMDAGWPCNDVPQLALLSCPGLRG